MSTSMPRLHRTTQDRNRGIAIGAMAPVLAAKVWPWRPAGFPYAGLGLGRCAGFGLDRPVFGLSSLV